MTASKKVFFKGEWFLSVTFSSTLENFCGYNGKLSHHGEKEKHRWIGFDFKHLAEKNQPHISPCFRVLILIPSGKVKVDLDDFDVKLQKTSANSISKTNFYSYSNFLQNKKTVQYNGCLKLM
jgi:hypothetical protein